MPVPLSVKRMFAFGVMLNPLAPELKITALTSVNCLTVRFIVAETAKVAVSAGLLGTVAGVQFEAVFQSPLAGLAFHVALPAEAACTRSNTMPVKERMNGRNFDFMLPPRRNR